MGWLNALLRLFRRKRKQPSFPIIRGVRVLSQSMTVTWSLPTKYTDGSAIASGDIVSSEVSLSADNGATWAVLANVQPNATQTLNKDLADGAYKLRILEVTKAGVRGIPAIADVVIKTPLVPAAPSIGSVVVV